MIYGAIELAPQRDPKAFHLLQLERGAPIVGRVVTVTGNAVAGDQENKLPIDVVIVGITEE